MPIIGNKDERRGNWRIGGPIGDELSPVVGMYENDLNGWQDFSPERCWNWQNGKGFNFFWTEDMKWESNYAQFKSVREMFYRWWNEVKKPQLKKYKNYSDDACWFWLDRAIDQGEKKRRMLWIYRDQMKAAGSLIDVEFLMVKEPLESEYNALVGAAAIESFLNPLIDATVRLLHSNANIVIDGAGQIVSHSGERIIDIGVRVAEHATESGVTLQQHMDTLITRNAKEAREIEDVIDAPAQAVNTLAVGMSEGFGSGVESVKETANKWLIGLEIGAGGLLVGAGVIGGLYLLYKLRGGSGSLGLGSAASSAERIAMAQVDSKNQARIANAETNRIQAENQVSIEAQRADDDRAAATAKHDRRIELHTAKQEADAAKHGQNLDRLHNQAEIERGNMEVRGADEMRTLERQNELHEANVAKQKVDDAEAEFIKHMQQQKRMDKVTENAKALLRSGMKGKEVAKLAKHEAERETAKENARINRPSVLRHMSIRKGRGKTPIISTLPRADITVTDSDDESVDSDVRD